MFLDVIYRSGSKDISCCNATLVVHSVHMLCWRHMSLVYLHCVLLDSSKIGVLTAVLEWRGRSRWRRGWYCDCDDYASRGYLHPWL